MLQWSWSNTNLKIAFISSCGTSWSTDGHRESAKIKFETKTILIFVSFLNPNLIPSLLKIRNLKDSRFEDFAEKVEEDQKNVFTFRRSSEIWFLGGKKILLCFIFSKKKHLPESFLSKKKQTSHKVLPKPNLHLIREYFSWLWCEKIQLYWSNYSPQQIFVDLDFDWAAVTKVRQNLFITLNSQAQVVWLTREHLPYGEVSEVCSWNQCHKTRHLGCNLKAASHYVL